MSNLASILRDLGDLQSARDLAEQALAGRQQVLDDAHPDTLSSRNNPAGVRRELDGRL
jgi:hypothetical protein